MIARTQRRTAPTVFWVVAGVVGALGLGVSIWRLAQGLGATTNLSDAYPWGLWIVFDIFLIPFSAGAFTMAAIANIMNKDEYHAIARPVILAGFLGYAGVVAILLLDLARWHQFYKILWPGFWNLQSFMLEVTLCITLYTIVLLLELSPLLWERFRMASVQRGFRLAGAWIAGAGIVLSCLHQASLGSLFLLMRESLQGLWWSPMLPLFFLLSAVFSGLAMIIFVTVITGRAYGYPGSVRLLPGLAQAAAVLLALYGVLRLGDLVIRNQVGLMFGAGSLSLLFWGEIIIGLVIPLVLFALKSTRERGAGLLWGAICVIVGLALNRASVGLFALERPAGAQYFPSLIEFMVVIGVLAIAAIAYAVVTQYLPVFSDKAASTTG
ncbi:MAG: Ni/Fe-hydrogenase cytochrome b subunit [Chloroflexi bacterium B3_Chlor]|nr:MAG: Ni/Fe-hydrogenase cytochrome b subunit [Chloroflexi bacterium B3_Chlor]